MVALRYYRPGRQVPLAKRRAALALRKLLNRDMGWDPCPNCGSGEWYIGYTAFHVIAGATGTVEAEMRCWDCHLYQWWGEVQLTRDGRDG